MAQSSVFIACAMMLAVFDITKAAENGKVVEPKVEFTGGTIRWVPSSPASGVVIFTSDSLL